MPRGTPDYNVPEFTYFSIDTPNGDIVAERQGFSRLDNRGRVLLFEDWRNGLTRWIVDADPADVAPVHVHEEGRAIGFHGSLKCDPQAEDGSSNIYNNFLLPVSKRMGFEFSLWFETFCGEVIGNFNHNLTTGAAGYGSFRIKKQTGEFRISTASGDISIFTPASIAYLNSRWVSYKIVADFATGKWDRLMIGNVQYDLSNYSLQDGAIGISGSTNFALGVTAVDAVYVNPAYIGYVIISGDEP